MTKRSHQSSPPKATTITRDDWLQALEETAASQVESDPSLVSYAEFSELMGMAYQTAAKRLNGLVAAGKATRTTKRIIAVDGKFRRVTAFRLKKP